MIYKGYEKPPVPGRERVEGLIWAQYIILPSEFEMDRYGRGSISISGGCSPQRLDQLICIAVVELSLYPPRTGLPAEPHSDPDCDPRVSSIIAVPVSIYGNLCSLPVCLSAYLTPISATPAVM